jgi:hypothetical protein
MIEYPNTRAFFLRCKYSNLLFTDCDCDLKRMRRPRPSEAGNNFLGGWDTARS